MWLPVRGRRHLPDLHRFFTGLPAAGSNLELAGLVDHFLGANSRPGLAIVVSDFSPSAQPLVALDRLRAAGHEPFVVRVASSAPVPVEEQGPVELIDAMTGAVRRATIGTVEVGAYHAASAEHDRRLTFFCCAHGLGYLLLDVSHGTPSQVTSAAWRRFLSPDLWDPARRGAYEVSHPLLLAWALLAVPLLLARLRTRRRLVVADLAIWDQSLAERSWWDRHNAVLRFGCGLLGIVWMAVALAEPRLPPTTDAPLVLIVDTSASMPRREGDGSRWDVVRTRVRETMEQLPAGQRAVLIGSDAVTRVLCGWTEDRQRLTASLEAAQPTDSAGDLREALELAADLTAELPHARLIAFTDLAGRSGARELSEAHVEWVICGGVADNVGITRCQFRPCINNAAAGEVYIEVHNAGRATARPVLQINWADPSSRPVNLVALELPAGGTASHVERLEDTDGGLLKFSLSEPDALDADNQVMLAIPQLRSPEVVFAGDASQPLRAAIESLRELHINSAVAAQAEKHTEDSLTEPTGLRSTRLTVFEQVVPDRLPEGPCLVFGPDNDCDLWRVQDTVRGGVTISDQRENAGQIGLSAAVIEDPRRLKFSCPVRVLITTAAGDPVYSQVQRPAGDVLVFHAALEHTDLPAQGLLPRVLLDALERLSVWDRTFRPVVTTADMVTVAPITAPRILFAPDGSTRQIPAQLSTLGPLQQCGVWRLSEGNNSQASLAICAIRQLG